MYEVKEGRMMVRSSPSLPGDNFSLVRNRYFEASELVSVDLIRRSRQESSKDGPFLRLSDGSGWILAQEDGFELARRIPVEASLWTFYIDYAPLGEIPLSRHPVQELHNPDDNNRFPPDCGGARTYLPMQKIVCDRKVVQGDKTFYRAQGTYGWVLDRHSNSGRKTLIDGDLVETGLFAFRVLAIQGVSIRKSCHVGGGSNCTNVTLNYGEIVVAEIIKHSPLDHGNGPFLRLSDGSGWLFQHQHGSSPLLEEVPIQAGIFRLKMLEKIQPFQGQPIHYYYYEGRNKVPFLESHEIVVCDRKICNPSGFVFYRKQGTDLWISERLEGQITAKVLSEESLNRSLLGKTPRNSHLTLSPPWNPDFIRGNANGIYGLEENRFDSNSRTISYKTADNVNIHVYCETRMISIVVNGEHNNHKSQRFHRNCNDADLHAILNDPRAFSRGGHHSSKRARLMPSPVHTRLFQNSDELIENPISPDVSLSSNGDESTTDECDSDCTFVDAEETTRRNLLDCQNEIQNLKYQEGNLLRAVQLHEEEQAKAAQAMKRLTEQATAYRIQLEEEEDRRFRFGMQHQEHPIDEEDRRVSNPSGSPSSLVRNNVYVGSMVGCILGLALSPVCGPFLVRIFGLEHIVI